MRCKGGGHQQLMDLFLLRKRELLRCGAPHVGRQAALLQPCFLPSITIVCPYPPYRMYLNSWVVGECPRTRMAPPAAASGPARGRWHCHCHVTGRPPPRLSSLPGWRAHGARDPLIIINTTRSQQSRSRRMNKPPLYLPCSNALEKASEGEGMMMRKL